MRLFRGETSPRNTALSHLSRSDVPLFSDLKVSRLEGVCIKVPCVRTLRKRKERNFSTGISFNFGELKDDEPTYFAFSLKRFVWSARSGVSRAIFRPEIAS